MRKILCRTGSWIALLHSWLPCVRDCNFASLTRVLCTGRFSVAVGSMIRYIHSMKRTDQEYIIGNRPPQDLSAEAMAQLDRGHRSKVMDEMAQKASNAKVEIQLNKELFLSLLSAPPRKSSHPT